MTDEDRMFEIHTAISLKAIEVFGSKEEAERWLRNPALGLDGQRPVDLLESSEGTQLVWELLGRLEHGVYI